MGLYEELTKNENKQQKNNRSSLYEELTGEKIAYNSKDLFRQVTDSSKKMNDYSSGNKSRLKQFFDLDLWTGKKAKNLEKDKKYQGMQKEHNNLVKAYEEAKLKEKQSAPEKVLNTISGNVMTGVQGLTSAINKINPFSGFESQHQGKTLQEKLGEEAMNQTDSKIGKVGLNVLGSVSRMAPQMLAGNPIGATATGFANYGGGAYNQALQEGKTEAEATKYGLAIGTLEMGLQKALGGLSSVYGKSALSNVTNKVTEKVIRNKALREYLTNIGSEGLEEYLQDILNPVVRNITMGENNKFSLYTPEALESGLMGALTSGLLDSPLLSRTNNTSIENKIIDNINQNTSETDIQNTENQNIKVLQPKNPTKESSYDNISPETNDARYSNKIVSSTDNEIYNLNSSKNLKRVGLYGQDFYRNMRHLFDEKSSNKITGDFDKAKLNHVNLTNQLANDLKTNITEKYNIKKGSKDSELIQKYGEKLISETELMKESPKNWENIKKADEYFRKQYDSLIDKINATRKEIYPFVEQTINETTEKIRSLTEQIRDNDNNMNLLDNDSQEYKKLNNQNKKLSLEKKSLSDLLESDDLLRNKRVEKRQNYYRHFQEMSEGFNALRNILSTNNDIPPQLVGISDFTKPNTKFSSIAQKRFGIKTKYDAVGGFLDYINTASFMINIDPQIYKLRKLTQDMRNQMKDDTTANTAIDFLTEFTNILAGKTNVIDRPLSKTMKGRTALNTLNWFNSRIKSNMVLGNVSSSLSQVLNAPQVIGKVKNPKDLTKGFIDTIKGTDYSKSQFITERYKSDYKNQFEESLLKKPKKMATWMLGALDEVVTKTGWNALYNQAIEKGIKNPVQYADNNIRDLVAGRGIGEKTLSQESKVVNLLAPFTVEVGNMTRVIKDMGEKKDFLGLLITFISANLFNKLIKKLGGSGSTFDPIEALTDALTEKDISQLERLGRIAGEILGNVPLGQQLAGLYPEYGNKDLKLPTRQQLFGKNDPTRFGSGNVISSAIKDFPTTVATPWGGKQIEKTLKGSKILQKSGEYKNDKLKYPVSKDFLNSVKALSFGSTKETQEFYDKDRRSLSENQTKLVDSSNNRKKAYDFIMLQRQYNNLNTKIKDEYKKTGKENKSLIAELEKVIEAMNKLERSK